MSLLQNSNAISSGGYQISNSLRFQSASSQYLSRTFGTPTNNLKWTWSGWIKRGKLGVLQAIIGTTDNNSASGNIGAIRFEASDAIMYYEYATGYTLQLTTTQVFRDPSAWYHIVIATDTTQATASNRIKMYVNGVQITAFSTATYPSLNQSLFINSATATYQGAYNNSGTGIQAPFDGYLSEVNFIDGQALTPSSFGTTDPTSGQWVAAKYTGTYGTNGFYLPFSNGTSTTTLGADSSGNGNNWTLTNFTRSAGVSDCWMYDVPSGNGYSATQPSSNYAVLNPLCRNPSYGVPSAGNLQVGLGTTGVNSSIVNTISVSSGKWYSEFIVGSSNGIFGILKNTPSAINSLQTGAFYIGQTTDGYGYQSGLKYNGTSSAYGATLAANDVVGIALDLDGGTLTFYKNGVSQGTAFTGISGEYFFATSDASNAVVKANFGQRSFAYTPPSGFKALCTANLPVATIKQGNLYMDATLWTGNGASNRNIVNTAGFKPDLVWLKSRSSASWSNFLQDTNRGITEYLISNSTGAAGTTTPNIVNAVNSNGFQIMANGNSNNNGDTYVGWQWQAGQGTTSSNTSGSITSTVSVNATAGFSVVTYTGNATAGATVGHGLGVAPKMIIYKSRNAIGNWLTYHISTGNNQYMYMNSTAAAATASGIFGTSASTFTLQNYGDYNANGTTYVAYCFAEIAGYSKFGSYTGNGSTDGPFVYTGFRPKLVMTKRTDAVSDWVIIDTSRNPYNVSNARLYPDLSNAEDTADTMADIVSNGFKLRTTNTTENASGGTYIYMAFAENPFSQSNAR